VAAASILGESATSGVGQTFKVLLTLLAAWKMFSGALFPLPIV
jgi:hypothetical protein